MFSLSREKTIIFLIIDDRCVLFFASSLRTSSDDLSWKKFNWEREKKKETLKMKIVPQRETDEEKVLIRLISLNLISNQFLFSPSSFLLLLRVAESRFLSLRFLFNKSNSSSWEIKLSLKVEQRKIWRRKVRFTLKKPKWNRSPCSFRSLSSSFVVEVEWRR